jgi:hypothetical protein
MADTEVSKPQGDSTWYEPDSQAANSAYSHNHGFYSNSGHFVEMDDTPGYERIRMQHRIGNYTEIQSDGTEIHKIVGDNYEIVVKNNHVLIKGYCSVTIQGDSKLSVEGDVYQNIQGNVYQNIEGEMDAVVAGEVNITSESDINLTAGGLSGQVNINAPFGVHIDSDVTVSGSISSTGYISSNENVISSKKVFGALGFVTPLGVQIGIPDAGPVSPGIVSVGPITSFTSVTAPVLNDVYGPIVLMRAIFTSHAHPAPNGVTGIPFVGQL